MDFFVGMILNINDECLGTVTQVTDDSIYIDSECLRGWAKKAEIESAIKEWATPAQSPHMQPQRPVSVS